MPAGQAAAGQAADGQALGDTAAQPALVPPRPAEPKVLTVTPDEAEAILGREVIDPSGSQVGRLVDVLVDANGQPQAAVIDFGGFLGVGNRKLAVHWSTLHFSPAAGTHKITLDMTPDQIKAAPAYVSADQPVAVVTPADIAPPAR